jgi:hypothetical protein
MLTVAILPLSTCGIRCDAQNRRQAQSPTGTIKERKLQGLGQGYADAGPCPQNCWAKTINADLLAFLKA